MSLSTATPTEICRLRPLWLSPLSSKLNCQRAAFKVSLVHLFNSSLGIFRLGIGDECIGRDNPALLHLPELDERFLEVVLPDRPRVSSDVDLTLVTLHNYNRLSSDPLLNVAINIPNILLSGSADTHNVPLYQVADNQGLLYNH